MDKIFRIRFSHCLSGNLKSNIQNLKWVGIVALVVTLVICGAVAQAQDPKKIPRIGFLSNTDPATESTRSEAIRLAARAWLHRWTEHRVRVPICGGEAPSVP
jgi:hypothetical protein